MCGRLGDRERFEELERVLHGPQTYTEEQAEFIARHVANRKPLPGTALAIASDQKENS